MIYKIFLNHLPIDKSLQQWISITSNNRILYTQLKTKYFSSYQNNPIIANNLTNTNSKEDNKHNIENEKEIKNIINLDLSRTFQEISLFKDQKIITILFNILYIYNMEHLNTNPYKQGMNDICGVFLFVLYKNYRLTSKFLKDDLSFLYYIFHSNNDFLENDLFIFYSNFMSKGMSELYSYSDFTTNSLSKVSLEKKILLKLKHDLEKVTM